MNKFFKFIAFVLALLFSGFIGFSLDKSSDNVLVNDNKQNTTEAVTYNSKRYLYFSPLNKYVKYIGRSVYSDDTLWFSMSGSGIEFITSADSVDITFEVDNANYLNSTHLPRIQITVNGEIDFVDTLHEETSIITVDLSNHIGDKVIKVIKLSESMYSSCGISKISLYDDKDITPSEKEDLKIEFIGDSITAGYGIDEVNKYRAFSTETQNFSKTYAYLAADKLNADYSVVAFSGYGVLSGQNKTDCVISKYYEKAITSKIFDSPYPLENWIFSDFVPDIVVINLGVNDVSYCYTQSRKESFKEEYKRLIGLIRWHNEDAQILCVLGEVNNSLYPYIETAVKEYIEETDDNKIYCDTLDFEMRNYESAIDGHPSEESHIIAGENLVSMIKNIQSNNFVNSYEADVFYTEVDLT